MEPSTSTVSTPRPRGISWASALCWIWGALIAVFYLPTYAEAINAGRPRSYLLSHAVAAIGIIAIYWFAAYALRRRRRAGGVLAIGISGLFTILVLTPPDLGGLMVAAINVPIIVLVLFNWRHLGKPADDGVGA